MRTCLFLSIVALVATGEELLTPGEQVLRELEAALAEDPARVVALLGEAGELYRYPATPEEAAALLRAAGRATRHADARVQAAALRAIAAMGAPAGAAYVEPFLRDMKVAPGAEAVTLAAVEAAGRLRPPSLVPALLRLARKSKNLTLADRALMALGRYRTAPERLREQVTEKVLEATKALSRQRSRWRRLRAPALRALQLLTGRKLNSVEMFTLWWKYHRKHERKR